MAIKSQHYLFTFHPIKLHIFLSKLQLYRIKKSGSNWITIGIVLHLIVFAHVRVKAIKCKTMAFNTRRKFKLSEFFSRQCLHGDLDLRRDRAKRQFPAGGGTEL